jgi:hypothetical protein
MIASRRALVIVPLLLAVSSAGCGSSPPGANVDPAYPDVILQGTTTDAALAAILTATPVADAAQGATFDNPKNLATLPGTTIITFTWHDGQSTARRLLPDPSRWGALGGSHIPPPIGSPPSTGSRFEGILGDLLGERAAHAATPMTGPGYLLAFRALDSGEALFRVFTSTTSYTPDATAWAKIATGAWTTLQITSATFAADALAAGSSPITGENIKFCVGAWQ